MAAGDTIYNFNDGSDLSGIGYTGLFDTGLGFSGSSTQQDVQLGSPLVLDTSFSPGPVQNTAVTDFLATDPGSIDFFAPGTQSLSGTSETPPSDASQVASTPTPNSSDSSVSAFSALSALSKFGAGLSSLFGGQPRQVMGTGNRTITTTGASLAPTAAYTNGSMTLVLVVVVVALVLLMSRGE